MCGIIGIIGNSSVSSKLLEGLKRLEYRGYDSSGIATLENGFITCRRSAGRLLRLEEKLQKFPLFGNIGIGHTRWATHGGPFEHNAHPHFTESLAIVHNGIIENFSDLKISLIKKGYNFKSETDTEAIAYLITDELSNGKLPYEAMRSCFSCLQGSFSLAAIFKNQNNLIIIASKGLQLVIGYGKGEMYVASDAIALSHLTTNISYLENEEIAILNRNTVKIFDVHDKLVYKTIKSIFFEDFPKIKNKNQTFMQKEIYEQPDSISKTLKNYIDFEKCDINQYNINIDWKTIETISFSCCGTSFYASLLAKYWFEKISNIFVDCNIASEFRYRKPLLLPNTLSIFLSQSGETADTFASLKYCKDRGLKTCAIVNVVESVIARNADIVFSTLSGTEISVAATKTFTSQLAVLICLSISAGFDKGIISKEKKQNFIRELIQVPYYIQETLKLEPLIQLICNDLINSEHILYIGRGVSYPISLEGALKIKELSYIHAEGYAAGELKHGPIALVDENIPTIVIAPYDRWFKKTFSNIQEISARGGRIILITDIHGAKFKNDLKIEKVLTLPAVSEIISPIIYAIPIQLIAYHSAFLLGYDIDKPRNLAKSVTVE